MAWKYNSFTLIRGEDASLLILPMDRDDNPVPMMLFGLQGSYVIEFSMIKEDNTVLTKTNGTADLQIKEWGPPTVIVVKLTQAEVASLPIGQQTFQISMEVNGMKRIYSYKNAINVIAAAI